ncbi:ATP-binding protein [Chitinimonas sp. PSY-7]|uniref:ATP-binding protein n=1 Tax=Chitinimonas sp. PSY-7 TaxID=3459088 RepID=UPI0040401080
MPRTIFWRLTWLTASALIISLTFVVALSDYNKQQMIARQMSEQIVELLADLEDQLDGMSPKEQAEWISLNHKPYAPHLVAIDSPDAPSATAPRRSQIIAISEALQNKLARVGEVREIRQPKKQLWIQVDMLGQAYWLVIPFGRFQSDPTWTLAGAAAIFAIIALSVAGIFAWRLNRPLRELGIAAGKLGRGERPQPLPETGPLEVQELSASFNRMLSDLDTAEAERTVMLAGISHDLRTPLARLRLGVEMMNDASLQDGMREDVDDIERILSQFIDFARGLGNEQAQACDPAEIARGVVARFARTGLEVELQLADHLPLANLHPLALTRALANLLDNAHRYGASPLSLSVHFQANVLHFKVIDNGPGIPADQIVNALKPFHRLDKARRADGGSGLGLAIVERIARLHGGKLQLINRPEGGLQASLILPLPNQS